MTVREVADWLRVSKMTIKRWVHQGKIESLVINKRGDKRFTKKMVEDFLNKEK